MTVGVAVFGTVLAINGNFSGGGDDKTSSQVVNTQPTQPTSTGDGLQAGSLQFTSQAFGADDAPATADIPTGWKSATGGTRPKYVDPTGVWQIRFDTRGSKQTPDQLVESRAKSIEEKDLQIISRDDGTLIYTYVDQTRGPRMGLSSFRPTPDGSRTLVEITVGGRPQDEAGLRAVLQRATETIQLSGATGDTRPN
ncbi:hypothetical protein [Streptomyces sp. SID13031]|uniref:hypothetical protein n=1 Tax=Streptomyces sp. SID13031 TaxID=2706046 RepID=UPI001EF3CBC3|nr:hypothetical protein [Streptomyces sp. SID13031]